MRLDKRTFLYSASVLACSNIALQLLGFVYRIALSRLAGAEGLGVYRLVFSVYIVINTACLSGVTMACSRLGASKMAQGRPEQLRALMKLATGIFLVLFTVCVFIIVPFHDFIAGTLLGDDRTAAALPIMLACLFLTGFENIIKALFIGMDKVKYAAISETGEQIIRMVAVVGLLAAYGGQDCGRIAALIMLGMTLSECFSAGFLGILYRRHIATIGKGRHIKSDAGLIRQTAEIAAPLSIAAILGNVMESANAVILPQRLVVSGMTNSEALSALGVISGMAMPLIVLPVALISAVSTVLVPNITAAQARGDSRRVRELTKKALTVTGLIGIPATAAIVPLSPSLARIFFAQALPLHYMGLLGVSAVLMYYQMMTSSLLNGIGAQKRAVTAIVCGEVIQLVLTWFLAALPSLQIYGYIISMLAGPVFVILCNLISLRLKTGVQYRFLHTVGKPLLCGAMVYFWVRVFYGFFLGAVGEQWCAVLLATVSGAALYFAMLHLLGIQVWRYVSARMDKTRLNSFFSFL